jgi:hypothetical protein
MGSLEQFLSAAGCNVGKSLAEPNLVGEAATIIAIMRQKGWGGRHASRSGG